MQLATYSVSTFPLLHPINIALRPSLVWREPVHTYMSILCLVVPRIFLLLTGSSVFNLASSHEKWAEDLIVT